MLSLSVCSPLEQALRRIGYIDTSFEQHFYFKSDAGYDVDADKWYVTALDSDLDR